jgi:hypothetical protein
MCVQSASVAFGSQQQRRQSNANACSRRGREALTGPHIPLSAIRIEMSLVPAATK